MADCVLMDLDTALVTDREGNFCSLSCPIPPEGMVPYMFSQYVPTDVLASSVFHLQCNNLCVYGNQIYRELFRAF